MSNSIRTLAIMNGQLLTPTYAPTIADLFAPTPKAARRAAEFLATQIINDHTRNAYLNATRRFSL